jgi:GcrA cell cycle regulator
MGRNTQEHRDFRMSDQEHNCQDVSHVGGDAPAIIEVPDSPPIASPSSAKPLQYWTSEEDEHLRAHWRADPAASIAKLLGRTRSAVIARAHRLGLPAVGPVKVKKTKLEKPKPRKVIDKPVVKPVEPAEPPKPTVPTEPVNIFDLRPFDCRWPIGDPQRPDFGFCGAPANRPYGYCAIHRASAKVPRSS